MDVVRNLYQSVLIFCGSLLQDSYVRQSGKDSVSFVGAETLAKLRVYQTKRRATCDSYHKGVIMLLLYKLQVHGCSLRLVVACEKKKTRAGTSSATVTLANYCRGTYFIQQKSAAESALLI